MAQKLTKMVAAARLDVSQSTIDRMIQRGELQIEKEPHGSRHRIWVMMDDEEADDSANPSREVSDFPPDNSPDPSVPSDLPSPDVSGEVEVAVLKERLKSLEELADYHRDLLKDSEWRYQQAMEQLSTSQRTVESLTRALPAPEPETGVVPRWSWWPFGRGKR